jgi:hypothetical protein
MLKVSVVTLLLAAGLAIGAPRFNAKQELERPTNYRDWVFLTSGLGMAYGPAAREAAEPVFDNVFVEPKAHAAFLKSGKWPDGTTFVLEVRRSRTGESINKTGRSQGDIAAVEVSVKDTKRFKDGWGYFNFRADATTATVLGEEAGCNTCHRANTAVENTFVQFYPTLLSHARAKGVLKASYLEAESKK